MARFTAESTPAEVVNIFPAASDLFKEKRIDFCCGGDKPLQDTFQKQSLDAEAILTELNNKYTNWTYEGHKAKDWNAVPLVEIIEHIVHHHHAYLYENLPGLGELVLKVFRIHGGDHPHLKDLHRLYSVFRSEMEEHSLKEEQEVFPLILKYVKNPNVELLKEIRIANGELEDEHNAVGDILKEMRKVTNGFTLPEGACNSYRITYARLKDLEEETFQHVHLENNVLFKRLNFVGA